jgi:hypothetical protein
MLGRSAAITSPLNGVMTGSKPVRVINFELIIFAVLNTSDPEILRNG